MNQKELEIFELGIALARALNGDNKAIADLPLLYQRHPEMFKDMKDLIETIEKVVQDPDLVMKNPQFDVDNEILAAKKLDTKKMGDVIIKNDKGTNVIFHANKKKIREFKRLEEKLKADGKDAQSLHSDTSSHGRVVYQSTLSSADSIISKNPKHDSLNNKNSNQTPNQSDDKSNSQADDKKQALQYLRDNKPNIDSKESKHSSKDKSSKESSNQSGKLLEPNKQNKSENKPNTRKQRK